MFFNRMKKSSIRKFIQYLTSVDNCKNLFRKTVEEIINKTKKKKHKILLDNLFEAQLETEKQLREIEKTIENKIFSARFNHNIFEFFEIIHKLPCIFTDVCHQFYYIRLDLPTAQKEEILNLIQTNISAYKILRKSLKGFFYKVKVINEIKEINIKKTECYQLEKKLYQQIDSTEIEKNEKVFIFNMINTINQISMYTSQAASRLKII